MAQEVTLVIDKVMLLTGRGRDRLSLNFTAPADAGVFDPELSFDLLTGAGQGAKLAESLGITIDETINLDAAQLSFRRDEDDEVT